MIDHLLGRPSVKSRRLQVLAVLAFWSAYLYRGHRHGPPVIRLFSKVASKKLTTWQAVIVTMVYLYAARNFSTLVGLASPEPMANMYDSAYFRATWVLTALDAGFWTAMRIKRKWLRDLASFVFTLYYLVAAEQADEKVRRVRGMLTVDHMRVSWNKGTTPYLQFFQNLVRPRFTRWPPRAIRIPRPSTSDYKEPVSAWLYYDGPVSELEDISKILLDIPGGGFVAMDPRCNDDKLFAWAGKTGLPVLSLDYKKAPEFPYPYALNECYDVYTTIMRSRGRCLGMSGRVMPKIVVTGDSAGGNLATAMTLMVIESSTAKADATLADLPIPDGLILLYPALDMNIGNWMSDEQMALVQDRGMRKTNKDYIRRKTKQYNDLVGTPIPSDGEDDTASSQNPTSPKLGQEKAASPSLAIDAKVHPEFSHAPPPTWTQEEQTSPISSRRGNKTMSFRQKPLRTRLAMASMLSYFNDRVLTPEMMRAMIIIYIGPHNRPDFSQDYLLSPILSPDMLLQSFPKTYFLTGERDPLVDDTVIFAGRLRKVKRAHHTHSTSQMQGVDDVASFDDKDVAEVVLIPGISHGFSQFPTVYPPAWKFIDRCATWTLDLLNAAEARELREKAKYRRVSRAESSGDEDRPLEMSMTKMRSRTSAEQSKGSVAVGDYGSDREVENGGTNKKKRMNSRPRFAREKSLVRLNSSDDLLGRRMQGLAGPLTSTGEEHD